MLARSTSARRGNSAPATEIAAKWQNPIFCATSYHIFLLLLAALAFNSSDNGGNGPSNTKAGAKKQLNRPSQIQQHETIFSIVSPQPCNHFFCDIRSGVGPDKLCSKT